MSEQIKGQLQDANFYPEGVPVQILLDVNDQDDFKVGKELAQFRTEQTSPTKYGEYRWN